MADVTTYKRATVAYASGGVVIHVGDVRAATDAAVTANPQWWVALTDADLSAPTDGKTKPHQW